FVYVMLASPAAILAIISGSVLVAVLGVDGSWLLAKLAVVVLLALYHTYCGHLLHKEGHETRPEQRSTWRSPVLILIPVFLIAAVFVPVLAKPDVVLEYQVTPKPASYRNEESTEQRQIQTTAVDGSEWVVQTG